MPETTWRRTPIPPRLAVKTEMLGPIRISPSDKAEIQRRAEDRGMDMTTYLTEAALQRLDENFTSADDLWRQSVDRRLERLETLAYGTE